MRKSSIALYAPFIAVALVQALFVAFLPSTGPDRQNVAAGQFGGTAGSFDPATGAVVDPATGQPIPGATASGGGAAAAGAGGGRAAGGAGAASGPAAAGGVLAKGDTSHCKNGRQFQKFYGYKDDPLCVPKWPAGADNGGATYQGVTKDSIKVVIFNEIPNPLVQQALAPQGLSQTDEQRAAMADAAEAFIAKNFETYGRKIEWVRVQGDCPQTPPDNDKCLAAAREVIKMKPFMVAWASPLYPVVFDEWAKAGIVTLGGWHFHDKYFTERRPYRYDVFMDGTRTADMVGEYFCKKLAGKNADHAGQTNFPGTAQPIRLTKRKVGISVPEVEANVSTAKRLAETISKCDPGHSPVINTYESNIETAQSQSDATTQKYISEKVTTVICLCDPIAPIFGGGAFTRAGYFPENLIPGSGLTDYDKLGRLYDKQQQAHAFGPSHLRVEVPFHDSDASIVWRESGKSGEPCASCNLNWAYYALAATVIHLTGPNLNPLNVERSLLSAPQIGGWEQSGRNPNVLLYKFGPGDYTALSDAREIFWDEFATSKIDGGRGAYVPVDGGRRYELGGWPAGLSSQIPVRP